MAELRSTDFLPKRFHGDVVNANLARAHFLAFTDYLEAHDLLDHVDDDAFQAFVSTFKRTLHGTARIWDRRQSIPGSREPKGFLFRQI